ncbi:hypothetical protein, partial [Vibrio harveyi]|uniref:hypothetical protein n=1 Tax=Vibrio harveyi TaxID=669 RepID=UPI001E2D43F2
GLKRATDFEPTLMTIYTAGREPIHLARRLTSTGFQTRFHRRPPKSRSLQKSRTLAMGFGFFV